MTSSHTPSTWMVCTTGQARVSPSGVLATMAESSRLNSTLASASRGDMASNQSAEAAASSAEDTMRTPLPS